MLLSHEDVFKRCDGRTGKIVELIKSKESEIKSEKVDVISKDKIMTLKRPINKLFPLEFSHQKNIELNFVNEKDIPQVVVEGVCVRRGGAVLRNQKYARDLKIT